MAKNCLNRMILDLESAHVSLPPEYTPPDFDDPPDAYRIVGDTFYVGTSSFPRLRFASLEHISFGGKKENGIAEIVYYVQALEDGTHVLKRADSLYPYPPFEEKAGDPVLCENVKTLQFKYYNQEGTEYELWDSDAGDLGYATPRAIRIKLEIGKDSASRWFETMVTLPVYREEKK
jgi:general secretion pathway protein J